MGEMRGREDVLASERLLSLRSDDGNFRFHITRNQLEMRKSDPNVSIKFEAVSWFPFF